MKFKAFGEQHNKKYEMIITANNEKSAIEEMKKQGYKNVAVKLISIERAEGKVNSKELYQAFLQFYYLTKTNMSLDVVLLRLAEGEKNKILKYAFFDISEKIKEGVSLQEAFEKHKCFPLTVTIFIGIAERVGGIAEGLKEICLYFKQVNFINSKMKSTFRTPQITLITTLIVFIGLSVTFIPTMKMFFQDTGITLPLAAKIIYAISDFMINFWVLLLPSVVAFLYFCFNTKTIIPETHDKFLANGFIVKKLMRDVYMFRFLKSLQLLNAGNTEMVTSLILTASSMDNIVYKDIVLQISKKIQSGFSLKESIIRSDPEKHFDSLCINFIESGENSGNLTELLKEGSEIYKERIEENVEEVATYLNALTLLIMAIAIGGLMAAVFLPTFRLHEIIGK